LRANILSAPFATTNSLQENTVKLQQHEQPTPGRYSMNATERTQSIDYKTILKKEERQPCEIWTRVMGYHRPVASFNIGKQGEFLERRFFRERVVA
jgi:hypothetical protein